MFHDLCLSVDRDEMPISVVVPVFNSQASLRELVDELLKAFDGRTFELILVDDGSRDKSWRVVSELARQHAWIRGIELMRNYGQHNALLCGLRAARYEIVATIDDDLQNPPAEIFSLLSKLEQGYDVVYGTPKRESHGFLRDLASRITKLTLQEAMGAETASRISAFRVFRTNLREAFANYNSPYVSIDVLLTWATQRFASVPVENRPRTTGASNYTLRKLMVHALNMATGFSSVPLQLSSLLGFGFTLLGFVVLIYVLFRYFTEGGRVPGFAFLSSMIAIFSGAQLFALGIMGEYLARMHMRTMNRPSYAVRTVSENPLERIDNRMATKNAIDNF
jgi:undecaprenyl-phosphate 4-deoxy-4-formamido-L-arabinose transferase